MSGLRKITCPDCGMKVVPWEDLPKNFRALVSCSTGVRKYLTPEQFIESLKREATKGDLSSMQELERLGLYSESGSDEGSENRDFEPTEYDLVLQEMREDEEKERRDVNE